MDIKEFESLNPQEQAKIFHQSHFKDKGELLLHAHDPGALARSLSDEELYLVTREVDLEEKSEVIKYASLPQLLFVSDIDCWKKDRIDPDSFIRWLEVLLMADERKLLQWLTSMDDETIITGFKKVIQVLKPEREYAMDEALGDTPYFTFDDYYYVMVHEENLETVRRALQVLFENARGRYVALLENILNEMEDFVEEEAYQRREIRLAEHGFPDTETAQRIYRPITRHEFDTFPLKNEQSARPPGIKERIAAPNYPVLWSGERLFLDEVLFFFRDDPANEQLQEELAWLSNKVIAGEGIDFSSEERVRHGVERARSFVSIGLELLSEGNLERARKILTERWLEMVFRWGVTQVMAVKTEALDIMHNSWKGSTAGFTAFLNPPYEFIFRGLFLTVPEYHDAELREHPDALRDFRTAAEIEKTHRAVQQIRAAFETLNRHGQDFTVQLEGVEEETGPSLFAFFGATFAHFLISGKASVEPFPAKKLKTFLQKAFIETEKRRSLDPELRQKFRDALTSPAHAGLLVPFWGLFFESLEEDLESLNPSAEIESRYIAGLWLSGFTGTAKAKKPVATAKKNPARGGKRK